MWKRDLVIDKDEAQVLPAKRQKVAPWLQSSSGSVTLPRRRLSKKLKLALDIAANPLLVGKCRDLVHSAAISASSASTNNSRRRKYEDIMLRMEEEPYPLTFDKIDSFLCISIVVRYMDADGDCYHLMSYCGKNNMSNLTSAEASQVGSTLAGLRRKGYFSHDQKQPIFLSSIVPLTSREDKAVLLLAYFFALRKSEVKLINSTIKIIFHVNSISCDFRAAVLKSNVTAATAVKCLCGSHKDICLHSFRTEIENINVGTPGDLAAVIARNFKDSNTNSDDNDGGGGDDKDGEGGEKKNVASHSIRVGSLLHNRSLSKALDRILVHYRWTSYLMYHYYSRIAGLYPIDSEIAKIDFLL